MKLDSFEKQQRKDLIESFGDSLMIRRFDRVTIAFVKTGPNRGKIAWAIHSPNDGKPHRKYGEWVALERLYDGGMPIEFYKGDNISELLYEIVDNLCIDN